MTETTTRRQFLQSTPHWVWLVLLGSLAVNLVIAGSWLGHRLRPQHGLPPGIANRLAHEASAPLLRDLSAEKRMQIRAIFETSRGSNRAVWQAVRERRAEVTHVLEANPFDKAAYVAAMTRLIEAEAKARVSSQGTFGDVAATLSVRERQDFLANHRLLRQQIVGPNREGRDGRK